MVVPGPSALREWTGFNGTKAMCGTIQPDLSKAFRYFLSSHDRLREKRSASKGPVNISGQASEAQPPFLSPLGQI
jgi:hypothetical protein